MMVMMMAIGDDDDIIFSLFMKGYFEFADGLRVEMEDWKYCDGELDRAFKSEDENGVKPAGSLF